MNDCHIYSTYHKKRLFKEKTLASLINDDCFECGPISLCRSNEFAFGEMILKCALL